MDWLLVLFIRRERRSARIPRRRRSSLESRPSCHRLFLVDACITTKSLATAHHQLAYDARQHASTTQSKWPTASNTYSRRRPPPPTCRWPPEAMGTFTCPAIRSIAARLARRRHRCRYAGFLLRSGRCLCATSTGPARWRLRRTSSMRADSTSVLPVLPARIGTVCSVGTPRRPRRALRCRAVGQAAALPPLPLLSESDAGLPHHLSRFRRCLIFRPCYMAEKQRCRRPLVTNSYRHNTKRVSRQVRQFS